MKNEEWKRALGLKVGQTREEAKERVFELGDKIKVSLWLKILLGTGGLLTALFFWGLSIEKVCVPGNPDFEKGVGFCTGNGRKDKIAREQEEKAEREREQRVLKLKEEKKIEEARQAVAEKNRRDAEGTFRAMRYICEAAIKGSLREPGSYERIDSTFYGSPNGGSKKGVIIEYRARNGFGGMNIVRAGCLTETGRVEDLKLTGTTES